MKCVTTSFSALSDISVLEEPHSQCWKSHFSGLWPTGDNRFLRVLDEVRVVSLKTLILSMEILFLCACSGASGLSDSVLASSWCSMCGFLQHPKSVGNFY